MTRRARIGRHLREEAAADTLEHGPSKTQVKAAMQELQRLGESLLDLGPAELAALDLGSTVLEALETLRGLSVHGARARQLQYLGKCLRELDDAPLQRAQTALLRARQQLADQRRLLESWRTRLLADDAALTELGKAHPGSVDSGLRSLLRKARAERAAAPESAGRAYRELYAALRDRVFRAVEAG
ncbi:MAG TPA: ribosome biogenesis factor YjgA [Nevskiaceae bacterium]|nr:ribosome biogenesis factor YjgA [Nevskiaceae bacterium]